jgi:hypothetical protein
MLLPRSTLNRSTSSLKPAAAPKRYTRERRSKAAMLQRLIELMGRVSHLAQPSATHQRAKTEAPACHCHIGITLDPASYGSRRKNPPARTRKFASMKICAPQCSRVRRFFHREPSTQGDGFRKAAASLGKELVAILKRRPKSDWNSSTAWTLPLDCVSTPPRAPNRLRKFLRKNALSSNRCHGV